MYIVKVLKRRDAASVVLAIIIGMTFVQTMFLPIAQVSYKIANTGNNVEGYGYGGGWRDTYLTPFIELILTFLFLEIALRLVVWIRPMFVRKKR